MNEQRRDTREDVWIAAGIERPFRVCSERETFGEFDRELDAQAFLHLLIAGNPHLRKLT